MVNRISDLFALLGWLSVLVLAWLLVMRRVPSDGLTWGIFIFFFLFAVVASGAASYSAKLQTPDKK